MTCIGGWPRLADTLALLLGGLATPAMAADEELGQADPANVKFLAFLGRFISKVRKGSLIGNILIKRCYQDQERVSEAGARAAVSRFVEIF